MPKVTKIPPRLNPATFAPLESVEKRKVAGYARVSTDSEEQKTSYTAQVDYYTKFIKERIDWEFVGVYTDEGISATNTRSFHYCNRYRGNNVSDSKRIYGSCNDRSDQTV